MTGTTIDTIDCRSRSSRSGSGGGSTTCSSPWEAVAAAAATGSYEVADHATQEAAKDMATKVGCVGVGCVGLVFPPRDLEVFHEILGRFRALKAMDKHEMIE